MGRALEIRTDVASVGELRRPARREGCRRTATRMLGIVHALDGERRTKAARLVGLERQALRDAVVRYNAEGLDGLADRLKLGRPPTLDEGEQAEPLPGGAGAYSPASGGQVEDQVGLVRERFFTPRLGNMVREEQAERQRQGMRRRQGMGM